MTMALRVKGNMYAMDVNNPLQPTEESLLRVFAENVQGFLVNQPGVHWVAFRVIDGVIWLLDSTKPPESFTFQQLLAYVHYYPHAFLLQALNG